MNINKDLQTVDSLITNQEYNRWKLSNLTWIFPFTNENIKSFFNNFEFKNKKCLTVLSGGDFVLDMYLKGANDITTFDINPLTYYFFNLKKAALQADFSLKDFNCFFLSTKRFNKKQFEILKPYLDAASYEFWNFVYKKYDEDLIRRNQSLFHECNINLNILKKFINYLNDENYLILKEKIEKLKINFIGEDIRNLYKKNLGTYDFIYFSNIIEYAYDLFYEKVKNKLSLKDDPDLPCFIEYRKLMDEYKNNLNPGGTLVAGMISYIYDSCGIGWHNLNSNESRKIIFDKHGFKDITFPSLDGLIDHTDEKAVGITYQKKL